MAITESDHPELKENSSEFQKALFKNLSSEEKDCYNAFKGEDIAEEVERKK